MVLPDHGGVTGWAALSWEGARWFNGVGPSGLQRPVTLVTAGDDIRMQPGIGVSAERLDPRDVLTVDGVRVTTRVRSTWFEMRYSATDESAAVALSMAAYDDLVSIDEMAAWSVEHPGWTGAPRCRAGTRMAHENCWSPTEVMLATTYEVEAGLPRPLCNRPMFDRSTRRHIGTPDLLDLEAGVVGEYDGPTHLNLLGRSRDVRREETYRRHGLEYFTMLATDIGNRPALVDRIHSTRRRAAFAAESERSWTIEPPSWWIPTHTVALRRALPEELQERLLRYRRAA
jgi:hypothetical protein